MNRTFILRHGIFGKSRRHKRRGGPDQLRYGTRSSGKLVRCYWKHSVDAYRVEIELHSRLLRELPDLDRSTFHDVSTLIMPQHFRLVRLDWPAVEKHLRNRTGVRAGVISRIARRKASQSIRSALRYLSNKGLKNVHRFLRPLAINRKVQEALWKWSSDFQEGLSQ